MGYKLKTLGNGLRIVTIPMVGVQSAAAMVWVSAGTRHEERRVNGIAHFLEHMVFKGTQKYRNQAEISRRIEGVGGVLNAYTDTEFTSFFCRVPKNHLKTSLDVISELALHPLLPEKDIKTEAGNVIEEINRRQDAPDTLSLEVFLELLYPNQSFGRSILGTHETVSSLTREDMIAFRKGHYSPDRMVVVVAGAVIPAAVEKMAEKIFEGLPVFVTKKAPPVVEKQTVAQLKLYFKKTADQAHVQVGVRAFPWGDKDKPALFVLNSVLGQGTGCRLWLEIREKQGIAYVISSDAYLSSDTGSWAAYGGLSVKKAEEGIGGILKEMKKVREEKVPEKELTEAKERIRGPLLFALENPFRVAEHYGQGAVIGERLEGPNDVAQKIMAVTAEEVRKVAQRIFTNDRLNLAIVGPYKDDEKERFLRLLKLE